MNKMEKKKLLFLGTSNASCAMVKCAKNKGIYTIVTDNLEKQQSAAKQIADEIWNISTADVDLLEKKCREEGVNGVLCGISGFNIDKSLELTTRLNLPFYCSKEAWHYTRNKCDFKKLCRECNVPVAKDYYLSDRLTDSEVAKVDFPVVVKPVDRGSNIGISFCNNAKELRDAFKLVREVSTNPQIVVEKMLHGEEFFSSYAIVNGKARFLALNAMYSEAGYPTNCYTVTTTISRGVKKFLEEINPSIEKVLNKIGCTDGYAWVQVMKDVDDHFYVIEMGYRLDGGMIFFPYREMLGYDAISHLVDIAVGNDKTSIHLPDEQTSMSTNCGMAYMLWTKVEGKIYRIEGIDTLRLRSDFFVDVRRNIGDKFGIYRPLGTITCSAKNCDELCEKIDYLNKTVHIYDDNDEDILIKYTDFDNLKDIYKEEIK